MMIGSGTAIATFCDQQDDAKRRPAPRKLPSSDDRQNTESTECWPDQKDRRRQFSRRRDENQDLQARDEAFFSKAE